MHEVVKLTPQHATEVWQLFQAATQALRARGLDQWSPHYPQEKDAVQDLEEDCVYAIFIENRIAGVVSLNATQDEAYKTIQWKDADGKILVVHRLATHPDFQHRGLAKSLMSFAETLGRAEGYSSIRLDTYSQNEYSLALYIKLGYEKKEGVVFFPRRKHHFYCFEKLL